MIARCCGNPRLHSPREIMRRRTTALGAESPRPSGSTGEPRLREPCVQCGRGCDIKQIAAIEAEGGEVWRVVRTDLPADPDSHPSETA